jgi:hypothetical protein
MFLFMKSLLKRGLRTCSTRANNNSRKSRPINLREQTARCFFTTTTTPAAAAAAAAATTTNAAATTTTTTTYNGTIFQNRAK